MKRVLRILAIAAIIFAAMQLGIWVNKAMAQNVQLQWTATTTNCDLTVAEDVAGYVVLWGPNQGGPYPNEEVLGAPTISTIVDVGPQENTTLYFVNVAYDVNGNRSDDAGGCGYSNEVAVNFPGVAPGPGQGMTGAVVP